MMQMSSRMIGALALSVALGTTVAGISQERIPELQRELPAAVKGGTITGCVAAGAATGSYTLTNVLKEGDASTKDDIQRKTVALSGAAVDMSKHIGHQVTLTGGYSAPERATGTIGTAGTKKPAPGDAIEAERIPVDVFAVTALKMVAGSCAEPAI